MVKRAMERFWRALDGRKIRQDKRMRMHTKDRLAAALRKIGLHDMADNAAEGYYHDFILPLDTPCLQLATDLAAVGTPAAMALRNRHVNNGEFDANLEESEAWAASREGQALFAQLTRDTMKNKKR